MKFNFIPIFFYVTKLSRFLFCSLIVQMIVGNAVLASAKSSYEANVDPPITVSGTVTSLMDGTTLPGVNVLIKDTSVGTITDIDGRYTIEVPDENSILVFSFVGFLTEEEPVNGRSEIDVVLSEDIQSLGEVIVVGYGEQKKSTLTGAVEQISGEVFDSRAVTNPVLALQGQTPGLTVTRSASRPGREDLGLQIRGATSINGGSPLIVIDGSPAINAEAFYNMNPNDIESVSILKDASAAIYGSRAANGVILVTTKKGEGGLMVDITSQVRINTIGIRPPTPTLQEYATVWLEAAEQDGDQRTYWGWQTEENLLRMQRGEEGIYPTEFWGDMYVGDHPRFDEMYGESISNQQNVSISGASEKSNYRLSLGYAENVGNLKTAYDGQVQYNTRFNYSYQVADWLNIESGISYFSTHISSPSGGLGIDAIASDPPFWPSQNPYGQWLANFNIAGNKNAVAQTVAGGRENIKRDQLKINLAATIDLMEGLKWRTTASFDNDYYSTQTYNLTVPQYTWFGDLAPESVNPESSISERDRTIKYQNYGSFLDYSRTFGNNHHFSAMIGVTAELNNDKQLYGYRRGFEDYGVYDLNLGAIDQKVEATGGQGNWGLYSYVARLNYNYKEKYLLELLGRRDGSSKFHEDFRWSNFGGISAGWVLTEERFMEAIDPLNFLKIKASYGEMGNQVGIGNYDYLSTMGLGTALFGNPAALQNAAWLGGLTSLTRTWERVGIANIGAEFRMFDHRLFGSFDYYVKQNTGMLINVNYPDLLGGVAPKSNSGELETKGWEAVLGYTGEIGKLRYNLSVNMSDSRNEIVSMEGVSTYNAGRNATVQGYPMNSWFMYQTDGFFESEDAVNAFYEGVGGSVPSATDLTQRLRAGDTKKSDLDGDGSITGTGNVEDGNGDVAYMGDAAPHYIYGINIGLQYSNWDFTAFFQGVLDQNIQRSGHLAHPFVNVWSNQTSAFIGKTWTETNQSAEYPRMTSNVTRSRYNWQNNDFMLQNNRYLRLKSLVVGYSFADLKIANYNIDRVRLFFSGNDLFELTSIKDGYDPEFGESSHNSYPFNRTWAFGVNVTF